MFVHARDTEEVSRRVLPGCMSIFYYFAAYMSIAHRTTYNKIIVSERTFFGGGSTPTFLLFWSFVEEGNHRA